MSPLNRNIFTHFKEFKLINTINGIAFCLNYKPLLIQRMNLKDINSIYFFSIIRQTRTVAIVY